MRLLAATIAVGAAFASSADVPPGGCGRRSREPSSWTAPAGDPCGGPAFCAAPTECMVFDATLEMPTASTVYVCSLPCSTDADCAGFAAPMVCGPKGVSMTRRDLPSHPLCAPANANKGPLPGGRYR